MFGFSYQRKEPEIGFSRCVNVVGGANKGDRSHTKITPSTTEEPKMVNVTETLSSSSSQPETIRNTAAYTHNFRRHSIQKFWPRTIEFAYK